jgi:hypothetical protein
MKDFETIRGVKVQARNRLLAAPGVHSVAIGGKKTNEPAIVVFVTKKRAAA